MHSKDIISISAAVLAALAFPVAAQAQSASTKATVDAAKSAGIVGEQADGFLGFVTGDADPAVKAAVAETNAGRAEIYQQAAARPRAKKVRVCMVMALRRGWGSSGSGP